MSTNTRREDIIKAAKYHYGQGDTKCIMLRIRAVLAYHAEMMPEHVTWMDVMSILVMVTGDDVFKSPQDATRFLFECVEHYRMNTWLKEAQANNDGMHLLLGTYIHRLTMLDPARFGGSLPENCSHVQNFIDLHVTE